LVKEIRKAPFIKVAGTMYNRARQQPKGGFSDEEDDTEESGGEQAENSQEIGESGSAERDETNPDGQEHPV
jgi:hypothetical protein